MRQCMPWPFLPIHHQTSWKSRLPLWSPLPHPSLAMLIKVTDSLIVDKACGHVWSASYSICLHHQWTPTASFWNYCFHWLPWHQSLGFLLYLFLSFLVLRRPLPLVAPYMSVLLGNLFRPLLILHALVADKPPSNLELRHLYWVSGLYIQLCW